MDWQKIEDFCKQAHIGQRRKGGLPYYTHPIAVRDILKEYKVLDENILAAAILHDVLEDTLYKEEDILAVSNLSVLSIVKELTRIDPPTATWEEKSKSLNEKAKSFSREATYVKLADRIHNLQTAAHEFSPERVLRYARATLSLLENLPKADEYVVSSIMKRDLTRICYECIATFNKNNS